MDNRDLCANCNHWREEHYNQSGIFIGDKWLGCVEYQGMMADHERRKQKDDEIQAETERRREAGGFRRPEPT